MNVKIAPSILSADFAEIVPQMRSVEHAGAAYFHVDVMDGRFVPNLTWGPKIVADLRRHTAAPFDCHLMIVEPEKYVAAFRDAGADVITFHLEATDHAQRLLAQIRSLGAKAGIALCPQTPVEMLADLLDDVDLVLIMSVNPGFGGQRFIAHSLQKIGRMRAMLDAAGSSAELEVDGGVNASNACAIAAAGADVLVAGSAIFESSDPAARMRELREALDGVPAR